MSVMFDCLHRYQERDENYTLDMCDLHPEKMWGVSEKDCEKCSLCPDKDWQEWRRSLRESPDPSAPRKIYGYVDHYDVDVETGTVTYRVVRTNGDRIRAMSDEDLAEWVNGIMFNGTNRYGEIRKRLISNEFLEWLKEEVTE